MHDWQSNLTNNYWSDPFFFSYLAAVGHFYAVSFEIIKLSPDLLLPTRIARPFASALYFWVETMQGNST